MGIFSAKDPVANATQQGNRAARKAQAINQHQAGAQAGRGRRSIGGRTTARTAPSRRFNG